MKQLWKGLCDVRVPQGFLDTGRTLAFAWIVTWANDEASNLDNARKLLAAYDSELLECDDLEVIDSDSDQGELNETVDQARDNPNAILFGGSHSYPSQ